MKVIVDIDDSVSREEIQNWIDEVLMKMPPVIDAHITCGSCTCGDSKKLDIYRKAFCLFVNWAVECDFGYDNLGELADKYEKEFEEKGIGYIEGLMLIAIKEVEKNFPRSYLEEIESVEKELK